ncbi:molybdopterin-guanine dinucleotide biosynthesis protein B [Cohnella rhizosphaerae]|uniref:molybdopterin-guanine dinucleotide biosynthesis protein B n=1 Tax=Cohnella rhizosphaerae TaxID=1457232 RepID=UPI0030B8F5D4
MTVILPGGNVSEGTASLDLPDKDTWLHLAAGAAGTGASSAALSGIWTPGEASLEELAGRLPPADVILAEGFKRAPYAKWVLLREPRDAELLDALVNVVGVSACFPFSHPSLPVVDRNDVVRIAALTIAAART